MRIVARAGRTRSPGDVLLFARVLAFSITVPVLVRLGPARLGRVLEAVTAHRPESPVAPSDPDAVVAYVDAAMRIGRPVVRPGCLTRGVTTYFFLRRRGAPVCLHFGMGDVGADPLGHCWVTWDGEPFAEPTDPRPTFHSVYRIPARL